MKTIRLNGIAKNITLGILALVMTFSFTSCSKKVIFLSSSAVPGAEGYVRVKKDNNKNNVIQIEISNLAEVNQLEPAKQTYVVWMETDKNKAENLGQLKSSQALFSKQWKASFETVTSSNPIKVFITAENEGSAQYPGNQVVLSTDKF